MKSSSSWEEEEVEVECDDADDDEDDADDEKLIEVDWLSPDVAEHLHQAYRLVFISSAWFRPLLCGFNDSSLVLT